jgi:4-hydroxy-tetrahydrodipicolinate synthase
VESLSYPMLAVGAAGLMSALGNLLTAEVLALCNAVATGDHASARSLHRKLFALNQAIFLESNPVPLKLMLAASGLTQEDVRLPLAPAGEAVRARVLEALRRYDSAIIVGM